MTSFDAPPDDPVSNPSANPYFGDLAAGRLSRRGLLGGAAAATAFLAGATVVGAPAAGATDRTRGRHRPSSRGLLGFTAVAPSTADTVVVPEGYTVKAIIPWGDPIVPGGPAFRFDASNSADDQARQVGMGHDGMHFFPTGWSWWGCDRGVLVVNNEYTTDDLLFPDGTEAWTAEKTRKAQHAHGVTIVEIGRVRGEWRTLPSHRARRITATTPMKLSGPAAGHRLVRTAADPTGTTVLGTFNNCANGKTPWGTYLTCEENTNNYFRNGGEGSLTAERQQLFARYGIGTGATSYRWETTDDRFRADRNPNEPNRFGWVVEIDPMDPRSTPVKRTALGRFKHENAEVVEGRGGRIVVYLGDDERFEYLYKFVSAGNWRSLRARGRSPLDEGVLHVARFAEDGTGTWLPLVHGEGPLTRENGFADQGDVVVKARLAADLVRATKMDRPEWVAANPQRDEVFCTFTNNTNRTVADAANPRVNNRYGHIVRWRETGGDAAARTFTWEVFLLAGAGAGSGDGSTIDAEDAFGSPDGLAVDSDGRLWIQTDGSQPIACNDQMLVADPATGELRRFLVGVKGAEVTGWTATPDRRTVFVNLQHPGDAGTPTDPRAQSNFPDHRPDGRPRPATLVIERTDGGIVGT